MVAKRGRDAHSRHADARDKRAKKLRHYTSEDAELAILYEELASEGKEKRLQAAEKLVEFYRNKLQLLNENHFETLRRPFTRLARGLCSNRKAARVGFYIALSEILRLLASGQEGVPVESLQAYLKLVEGVTRSDSHTSNQEIRDHLLGHMLAQSVLLQRGLLFGSRMSDSLLRAVVEGICDTARRHPWLQEECGLTLYQALQAIEHEDYRGHVGTILVGTLRDYSLIKTPEGIAIWLQVIDGGTRIKGASQVWRHGNPLTPEEIPNIAVIMKKGNASSDISDHNSGERRASINFAWRAIFQRVFLVQTSQHKFFDEFWRLTVDGVYFVEAASAERKFLGFQIFDLVVKMGSSRALEGAFTQNLVKILVNQSSNAGRYLHDAAKMVLESIIIRGSQDQRLCRYVIEHILCSQNGAIDFDKRTGTKTAQRLCSFLDGSELENSLLPWLLHKLSQMDLESQRYKHLYQSVAELYLNVARGFMTSASHASEIKLKRVASMLECFVRTGFINYSVWSSSTALGKDEASISLSISDNFRSRFFSFLSQALSMNNISINDCVCHLPAFVKAYGHDSVIPLAKTSGEVLRILQRAEAKYDKLKEVCSSDEIHDQSLHALLLFYSITLLRAYDCEEEAIEILEDSRETVEVLLERNGDNERHAATNSLIELLLGSVSTPSALHRKVAEQVFTAFVFNINADGLNILARALLETNPLSSVEVDSDADQNAQVEGDSEESNNEDKTSSSSSEDSEREESGDEGSDEDVDTDMLKSANQHRSDQASDASDSEEARFNALLSEALKTPKIPNEEDAQVSSSEESSMDDEQMMELEPHLSAIFRERRAMLADGNRKGSKKEKRQTTEQIANFKNRILDLLLIFVKHRYDSDVTITQLILPVLKFIKSTSNKASTGKAVEVLRQYFDTARAKGMPQCVDQSSLLQSIRDIHAEAVSFATKQHAAACSRASLFLAKVLVEADNSNHASVMTIYAETAHAAFEQSSGLPSSFLTDGMNWSRSLKVGAAQP